MSMEQTPLGRHDIVIILGQRDQFHHETFLGLPGQHGVSAIPSLEKGIATVKTESALGVISVVTVHAVEFKNRLDVADEIDRCILSPQACGPGGQKDCREKLGWHFHGK